MAYEMTRENRDKRCQSNRNKADGVPLKQLTEETRREGAVVVAVIKKKGQESDQEERTDQKANCRGCHCSTAITRSEGATAPQQSHAEGAEEHMSMVCSTI